MPTTCLHTYYAFGIYIDCTQPVPNRVLSATLYMSILQSLIVYTCIPGTYVIICTVKPPNKGHFGDGPVVPCREVVLFSEVFF